MSLSLEETIENLQTIHFPTSQQTLRFMVINLSSYQQPCDVTFRDREPLLNVTIDKRVAAAADAAADGGLLSGIHRIRLSRLLNNIGFSDGSRARVQEIWTIHPLPAEGLSEELLASVNLSDGDRPVGREGTITWRDLVRAVYRTTKENEDQMLRRYLAIY